MEHPTSDRDILTMTASSEADYPNEPVQKLTLVSRLLDALHENNINYCHWKSSEHLDASMTGDTDLDVLFDHRQKDLLEKILKPLQFILFVAPAEKQYTDIVDFIGLDLESGKIIHLHTHYKLTLGENYLKGYQLDIEDKILSTRVWDEYFGIYRIDPNIELILLYCRNALKLTNRDLAKVYLKDNIILQPAIVKEYHWLKKRVDNESLHVIIQDWFKDHEAVYAIIKGSFDKKKLFRLKRILTKEFRSSRLYHPLVALFTRWKREATIKLGRKFNKSSNKALVQKRYNPLGGLTVGFIGADGSGKSTVTKALQKALSKKIDVLHIYFGSGKSSVSWYRKAFTTFKNELIALKRSVKGQKAKAVKKTSANTDTESNLDINGEPGTFRLMEAYIVAKEKQAALARMLKAKEKGMLVICDRYPQEQIMGYNDGPMLHSLRNSAKPLHKRIAAIEQEIYSRFSSITPDIVFKLIANADVVEARKPGETKKAVLEKKIEGIKQLTFAGSEVITINAEEPLETVLYNIRSKIWERFSQSI